MRNTPARPAISTGPALMIPAGYPRDLPSALVRAARDFGNAGVVEIGPDGRPTRLDFPILLELAARILTGLRANGVRAGDPAVVHCTEPVGFLAAFWACTLGGIRPVLMAPAADGDTTEKGRERLRKVTELLGWSVLIGRPSDLPDDLGLPVLDPDALAGHEPATEFHRPSADDVAVLLMSAGSARSPKLVQLTHRGLVEFAAGTPAMLPIRPGQTTLNWLPLDRSSAFLLYHLLPVFTGCTNIHVATDWVLANPLRWLDLMDQHRVNHSWAPNFGYRLVTAAIAAEPDRHWDLSALRSLVSSGEQITVPVMSEFLRLTNRFGVVPQTFVPAWGMTETVTGITFARPGLTPNVHRVRITPTGAVEWVDQRSSGKVAVARPGKSRTDPGVLSLVSVGAPAPGATVRIVGADGSVLPEGRIGQLQIASARVTPGYLGNPEADRAAFPAGNWPARKWLATGDQAFITGGQVVITGRDSSRIILKGQNHDAHEIEAVAETAEGVQPGLVAACGIPDPAAGTDRLVIFYSVETEPLEEVSEAIHHTVLERLGLAAQVIAVPRRLFPTTPAGKVLRTLLRQRWLDGKLESPGAEPAGAESPGADPAGRAAGSGSLVDGDPTVGSPYGDPTADLPYGATARGDLAEEDTDDQTTELPVIRLAWQQTTTSSIPVPPERPTLGAGRPPAPEAEAEPKAKESTNQPEATEPQTDQLKAERTAGAPTGRPEAERTAAQTGQPEAELAAELVGTETGAGVVAKANPANEADASGAKVADPRLAGDDADAGSAGEGIAELAKAEPVVEADEAVAGAVEVEPAAVGRDAEVVEPAVPAEDAEAEPTTDPPGAKPTIEVAEAKSTSQAAEAESTAEVAEVESTAQVSVAEPTAEVAAAEIEVVAAEPTDEVGVAKSTTSVVAAEPRTEVAEGGPAADVEAESAAKVDGSEPTTEVAESEPAAAVEAGPAAQVERAGPTNEGAETASSADGLGPGLPQAASAAGSAGAPEADRAGRVEGPVVAEVERPADERGEEQSGFDRSTDGDGSTESLRRSGVPASGAIGDEAAAGPALQAAHAAQQPHSETAQQPAAAIATEREPEAAPRPGAEAEAAAEGVGPEPSTSRTAGADPQGGPVDDAETAAGSAATAPDADDEPVHGDAAEPTDRDDAQADGVSEPAAPELETQVEDAATPVADSQAELEGKPGAISSAADQNDTAEVDQAQPAATPAADSEVVSVGELPEASNSVAQDDAAAAEQPKPERQPAPTVKPDEPDSEVALAARQGAPEDQPGLAAEQGEPDSESAVQTKLGQPEGEPALEAGRPEHEAAEEADSKSVAESNGSGELAGANALSPTGNRALNGTVGAAVAGPDPTATPAAESVQTKGAAPGTATTPDRAPETETAVAVEPIAIIGLAARFPGADSLERFWDNLVGGVESIRRFTAEDLVEAGGTEAFGDEELVAVSGALDEVEAFDAAFFGLSEREAELTDPAQRIFLEVCQHALEHGGYGGGDRGRVGLFAGSGMNLYAQQHHLADGSPDHAVAATRTTGAAQPDFLATRVAYRLGLTGPTIGVQTGSSSSLVAVHLACQALRSGDAELALAGAAAVHVPQAIGYHPSPDSILSPSGQLRAFDAKADGTVGGNGVAAVLLKRLDQAVADGDTIHAVIRGSAVSEDEAPKPGAALRVSQDDVIGRALEQAAVAADSLSYLEAHATGAAVGDPAEFRALSAALRRRTDKTGFCTIGSVKPNIGHLDSAAGLAGLIKVVLMLQHRTLVPTINYSRPNRELGLAGSPFVIGTEVREWESGTPLRAGVSAIGAGTADAAVILEEAPQRAEREEDGPVALPLSAADPDALAELAELFRSELDHGTGHRLIDLAGTAALGRSPRSYRLAVAGASESELASALATARPVEVPRGGPGPLGFAFTGQGAARRGMAAGLAARFPVFRAVLDECEAVYTAEFDGSLLQLLLTPAGGERVWPTETAQPALFAFEVALARLWQSFGVQPALVVGHSVGEYAALCVAGALSLADGVRLTAQRGLLMQRGTAPGAMVAVRADADRVRELVQTPGVEIAAGNGPQSFVLTGAEVVVGQLAEQLDRLDVVWQRLDVDRAFHSSLVEPILTEFADAVAQITLKPLRTPMVSSWSGDLLETDTVIDGDYLVGQLRQPVLFGDAVEAVTAAGCRRFLELGPDAVLSPAGRRIAPNSIWIPAQRLGQDPVLATMNGLAELYRQGADIAWSSVYADAGRVPLPPYPFRRVRHRVDASVRPATRHHAKVAEQLPVSREGTTVAKRVLDPAAANGSTAGTGRPTQERLPGRGNRAAVQVDIDPAVMAKRYQQSLDMVLDLTADQLGLEPYDLTVDHTFAELGADGQAMLPVVVELRRRFDVDLAVEELFDGSDTPHKVATAIASRNVPAGMVDPLDLVRSTGDADSADAGVGNGAEGSWPAVAAGALPASDQPAPSKVEAGPSGSEQDRSAAEGQPVSGRAFHSAAAELPVPQSAPPAAEVGESMSAGTRPVAEGTPSTSKDERATSSLQQPGSEERRSGSEKQSGSEELPAGSEVQQSESQGVLSGAEVEESGTGDRSSAAEVKQSEGVGARSAAEVPLPDGDPRAALAVLGAGLAELVAKVDAAAAKADAAYQRGTGLATLMSEQLRVAGRLVEQVTQLMRDQLAVLGEVPTGSAPTLAATPHAHPADVGADASARAAYATPPEPATTATSEPATTTATPEPATSAATPEAATSVATAKRAQAAAAPAETTAASSVATTASADRATPTGTDSATSADGDSATSANGEVSADAAVAERAGQAAAAETVADVPAERTAVAGTVAEGPADRAAAVGTVVDVPADQAVAAEDIAEVPADRTAGAETVIHGPGAEVSADLAAAEAAEALKVRQAEGGDFWRAALDGAEPLLLPTDRPRPAATDARATVVHEFDTALSEDVFTFSRERRVNPLLTVLAAVGTVLGRFARQDDVVIGVAGLPLAGNQSTEDVGRLPLRLDLTGEPELGELAQRVREAAEAASVHSEADLAALTEEPLFQVVVEFDHSADNPAADKPAVGDARTGDTRISGSRISGSQVSERLGGERESDVELELVLRFAETADGVRCTADYCADLFDEPTIQHLVGYVEAVLRRAGGAPDSTLPELTLPTAEDRALLVGLEGTPAVETGELSGLHRLFEQQVARTPEAVALIDADRELTYAELDRRANAVAWQLVDLGVRPGQLVAVRVGRGVDLVVGVLAVLKSGAAYLPLDSGVPESRWAFMTADAGAVALVGDDAALADRLGLRLIPVRSGDGDVRARQAPQVRAAADDVAYCIYTSGSNGSPKGVAVPHRGPVNLVRHYLRTRPSLRTLLWTSFGFDVHVQEMFTTLASGAALVMIGEDDRYDPAAVAAVLRRHEVQRLFMTFTPLSALLATGPELPALREIVAAGEALLITHPLRDFLTTHPDCALYNEYGPTEASVIATIHHVDLAEDRPSIGRPIDGVVVRLLDEALRPVPVGAVGEIHLGGVAVAQGYLGRPDETEVAFVDDPAQVGGRLYRSRDLGRWRPDGTLEYLGRVDDQVKVRGHRVEPGETEYVLADLPGVIDAVVVAGPDAGGDTCLIGYVVLADGDGALVGGLLRALAAELPGYLVPATLVPVAELPLTASGKLDRSALPRPDWSLN